MAKNKIIFGNEVLIDLTSDTVDTSNLLSGATAHDKAGNIITGACTYDADTSDADATASEILNTKTAYVNGNKITGSMPNRGAVSGTISTKAGTYNIQNGYHDGSGTVAIDSTEQAKIIAGNIKDGVQILGVTGTYTGEGVTAQAKSAIPLTTAQTILPDSGFDYLSQVEVSAIAYTETQNTYGTTVTIGTVASNTYTITINTNGATGTVTPVVCNAGDSWETIGDLVVANVTSAHLTPPTGKSEIDYYSLDGSNPIDLLWMPVSDTTIYIVWI